jgi:DNA-binding MarR family transcriptional regulator
MNATRSPCDLAYLLGRLERRVVERQRAALATEGCGVEEWRVVDFISTDGQTMSQVAEYVGLPSPTLTKLVDRLVANSLVYRRIAVEDRRKVRIFLTTRGKSLHRRLSAIVERSQAELLAETPHGELLEELLVAAHIFDGAAGVSAVNQ